MTIEHRIVGYDMDTDAELFAHLVKEDELRKHEAAHVIPDVYYTEFGSLELKQDTVKLLLPLTASNILARQRIQWFLEPSSVMTAQLNHPASDVSRPVKAETP